MTRTRRLARLAAMMSTTAALALASAPAAAVLTTGGEPGGGGGGGTPTAPPPAPAPVPNLVITSPTSVFEGNSGTTTLQFTVTLAEPIVGGVAFDFGLLDGTTDGIDHLSFFTGSVSSLSSGGAFTAFAYIVGDALAEADETFSFVLSNVRANGITYGGTIEQVFTILNDDGPVANAVPEPASVGLAGMGLLALALTSRRARRNLGAVPKAPRRA